MAVDQLVGHGWGRRENAEPGEGIDPLVQGQGVLRHALPADTMEAVAAANEIAPQLPRLAVLAEADPRAVALETMNRHVLGLEHDPAARSKAGVDQILGHLGLTVHGHGLAGERAEIDPAPPAAEAQLDAVVHQTDAMHPLADLRRIEQVDRALLEHARADPPLHVGPAAALQDHRLDALEMQELGEQEGPPVRPPRCQPACACQQPRRARPPTSIQQLELEQRERRARAERHPIAAERARACRDIT